MHEKVVNDKQLYVSSFQKRKDRTQELKKKHEEKKLEALKKFSGVNFWQHNECQSHD